MAIYFNREVQAAVSVSGGGLKYQLVQWHPVHEVLAVAAKNETTDSDGSVHFYSEDVSTNTLQFAHAHCVVIYAVDSLYTPYMVFYTG